MHIRQFFLGSPLPTQNLAGEQLSKIKALAAFSPDALSSIAYANQEIFLVLALAGSAGLRYTLPIGLTIVGVLAIVAFSYYQTIQGYPSGGGSYVVARENLGVFSGLVAGAALMLDYLLTAAVSLTAGVEAIASAFPALWPYRVVIALLLLGLITWINLRGVQESGTLIAIPIYLFLFTFFAMLVYGLFVAVRGGPGAWVGLNPASVEPLTMLLLLRAFSSGSTALTGIEAIANGVPSFRHPQSRNAGRTLIVMALLMAGLFVGSLGLTQFLAVTPGVDETILSALARRVFGDGLPYFVVQISTLLVLAVAANTSFAGFPRLASIMAKDGYLPHQLMSLGDRLVYANAMLLLAFGTSVLIISFSGDSHLLVPLFAVGAFLAFTLSQSGMVIHWWRERGKAWRIKALINAIGAVTTGVMLLVVATSKFMQGAWISLIAILVFIWVFKKIYSHYKEIASQLSLQGVANTFSPVSDLRLVIPISGMHRGVVEAVNMARDLTPQITAVYIEIDPGSGEKIRERWENWFPDIPLVVEPSPYRSTIGPILDFLDRMDDAAADGQLAALALPEFIPAKAWHNLLHNQQALLIKTALLYRRRHLGYQRIIIDLPYHLKK